MTWNPMHAAAAALLALMLAACSSGGARDDVVLATTTSVADTGLLDSLKTEFEAQSGWRLRVVSVGSGAALSLGRRGEADVLLVHSPAAEEQFMSDGYAAERRTVMQNDFVIVGPADDPAGVRQATDVLEALRRVAANGGLWIHRDDGSGTDALDRALWQEAGTAPPANRQLRSGLGMGPTLRLTDERNGYTLADRGTWLAFRRHLSSHIVFAADPRLVNRYSAIVIDSATVARGHVNESGARAFASWLATPAVQRRIGDFGRARYGEPLFLPAATTLVEKRPPVAD